MKAPIYIAGIIFCFIGSSLRGVSFYYGISKGPYQNREGHWIQVNQYSDDCWYARFYIEKAILKYMEKEFDKVNIYIINVKFLSSYFDPSVDSGNNIINAIMANKPEGILGTYAIVLQLRDQPLIIRYLVIYDPIISSIQNIAASDFEKKGTHMEKQLYENVASLANKIFGLTISPLLPPNRSSVEQIPRVPQPWLKSWWAKTLAVLGGVCVGGYCLHKYATNK